MKLHVGCNKVVYFWGKQNIQQKIMFITDCTLSLTYYFSQHNLGYISIKLFQRQRKWLHFDERLWETIFLKNNMHWWTLRNKTSVIYEERKLWSFYVLLFSSSVPNMSILSLWTCQADFLSAASVCFAARTVAQSVQRRDSLRHVFLEMFRQPLRIACSRQKRHL